MEFFWIPVQHGEAQQELLNAALKRLRVVAVERHFCPGPSTAGWAVCIDHSDASASSGAGARPGGRDPRKVDYREVLSAEDFNVYSALRDWRRAAAATEGVPIYAVMTQFVIFDPKRRVIHAAPFRERVLHHALMNVCGPVLERGAVEESHACRQGRGTASALAAARTFTVRHRWGLKLDIRRYFDSVGHEVLRRRYWRLFREFPVGHLLDRIVGAYSTAPGMGLPIGTLTSQYLANFYLDPLDRMVKEELRCRAYVRYMDDFILWSDSRSELEGWWPRIGDWLAERLHLRLNANGRLLAAADGIPFLGFRLLPGAILLGRRARRRFAVRLAGYHRAWRAGELGSLDLQRRLDAVLGHVGAASCRQWRGRVIRAVEEALPCDA